MGTKPDGEVDNLAGLVREISPSLAMVGLVALGFTFENEIDSFLRSQADLAWFQIAAGVVTLVVGTLLYLFRCIQPRQYGILEIVVGVAGAVVVANQIFSRFSSRSLSTISPAFTATFTAWFTEAAALYVIVRGYDNIYKSLSEGSVRRRWNRIFFRKDVEEKLS